MTRAARLNLALAVGIALAMLGSLIAGKVWIPLDAWAAGDPRWPIIAELRLPRTVLAALVGAALCLSGAAMQGYLRNPLADPGLFGVSAGAALGAVISLYSGYAAQAWLLPAFALTGVIVSSIAGSLTALATSLAPAPFATSQIVTWLMGALTDRSWDDVRLALPLIGAGMAVLALTGRTLDVLTLGESAARSMGVDPLRLQVLVVVGVALCVGASVATAGVIGFVGLIGPHMVRPFVGNRPSAVLLPSAVARAMVATDVAQFADRPVSALSGGEPARVLLARVLAGEPEWLLADEPLANLDPAHQHDALDCLRAAAAAGAGVVVVLHDLNHALRVADAVVLMAGGRIVAQGNPGGVLTPDRIRATYGVAVELARTANDQAVIVSTGRSGAE